MYENRHRLAGLTLGSITTLLLVAACTTSRDDASTTDARLATKSTVASASAAARSSKRSTTLTFNYRNEPPVAGSPVSAPKTSCVIPFSFVGSARGDFAGTSVQAGAAAMLDDGSIYANSSLVFTGTIGDCGTGTVVMRSTGWNRDGVTSGTVEIVKGSGTRGISGVTGVGTVVGGKADSKGTGESSGRVHMNVTC